MEKRARHYEYVQPEFILSLQEVRRTGGGEVVYNCPFCESRYGPNPERFYPKLYYNPAKKTGYCFRCGTVIVVSQNESSMDVSDPEGPLAPSLAPVRGSHQLSKIEDLSAILPIQRGGKRAMRYIVGRSPYIPDVLHHFDLAGAFYEADFGNGLLGVVFPFFVNGEVYSYQIRFFREDGGQVNTRYETRAGPKVPYSPFGLWIRPVDYVSLVEGVFGTFGLLYLSTQVGLFAEEVASRGVSLEELSLALSNPIATLGHDLGRSVLHILKELAPRYVVVAMDERRLSESVKYQIVDSVSSVERVDIIDVGDPDEFATRLYRYMMVGGGR